MLSSIYFCLLGVMWSIVAGMWLKQRPASKEKPFASILYTAVLGGKVALPCDISSPSADDSAALILWYKDDSAQPIYTLDSRRGDANQARQSSGPQLENRAYFNMINKPAFLQLDPVREEDAGEYRCRVDFHKARTVNTVITLKIIVPPGEPIILDEQGQKLEGLVGPYNEGDSLTITCQASGGKPRPSVTWWRDYALLDDNYTFELGDVVQNKLTIDKLHRHDLLAVLTCQASNNNITVPASNAITVDLNLKPVKAVITPTKKPIVADKETELTCAGKGSRPAGKITWWKGTQQMQNTRETIIPNGVISSVLTFTPSIDDNRKYLSCRVENLLIRGSAVEDGWKLDVQYPPQVTLQLGTNLKVTNIQEGNDVYFECNIRANPWIHEISWQFEGQDLTTNTSAGVIISNQSLVLQKVQRQYRGRFTCSCSNNQGLGISNEIFLKVQYAPLCKPGQKIIYGVAKYEPVEVLCELDADPNDVTFHWRFNSSYKRSNKILYSVERAKSKATYNPESDEDYGKLLCWGTNNIGIQRQPCIFTVVPAGPPDSLRNCSLLNQTEDLISVQCLEGYDGGMSQRFLVEVYTADRRTLLTNISSTIPLFVVENLPSGTDLILYIYATNLKGRSSPMMMSTSTQRPAEKLTRKGTDRAKIVIRPFLAFLIATVIALIIITLVLAIFIRYKKKRASEGKKRKRHQQEIPATPLKKVFDELDDKCPDIIPAKNVNTSRNSGSMDEQEQQYMQLNKTVETSYNMRSPSRNYAVSKKSLYNNPACVANRLVDFSCQKGLSVSPQADDITYADLSLFKTGHCLTAVNRREPPTNYAKLDFKRKDPERDEESETSLVNNGGESTV